ncbi:MAG TPA: aromatic ring-hydroxylating dioxygenase subunit alpha [Thermomicrobiales bacterium]|nr:aromatic ring-hydroxylating dioxygenase subunit alpha [Thermomicrobiales bacterium]
MAPSTDRPLSSPVSPAEVAGTRQATEQACTLPSRVYHDPAVLRFESENWFRKEWLFVGRDHDAAEKGGFFRVRIVGEDIIVVRGSDMHLRAFANVCRHRGATIVQDECGQLVRFQCPYHAWIYDLEGRLRPPRHIDSLVNFNCDENGLHEVALTVWQGFIFLNLDKSPEPFDEHLGEFPAHFNRFDLHELRRAKRMDYRVNANWKALMENYAECYHCPGVHPLLNHITPYNLGGYLGGAGEWAASWMELTSDYETLSTDGYLHDRPVIPTMRDDDLKRVYYAWIWPNLLFSLHPDFLMTHQVWPVDAESSTVICELYFHPVAMDRPDFDPSGPAEFWDITNREDWHVCELQQAGTASRFHTPGRYSEIEKMVHTFDACVADKYAGDGARTVIVRESVKDWGVKGHRRQDAPIPADD